MKTVTQNSMTCYTYNTKLCKSLELNRKRIQTYSYLKVKLSFITIVLNKSSFVKHTTILTAGNYSKSHLCQPYATHSQIIKPVIYRIPNTAHPRN